MHNTKVLVVFVVFMLHLTGCLTGLLWRALGSLVRHPDPSIRGVCEGLRKGCRCLVTGLYSMKKLFDTQTRVLEAWCLTAPAWLACGICNDSLGEM
jgi:hypothetical protein